MDHKHSESSIRLLPSIKGVAGQDSLLGRGDEHCTVCVMAELQSYCLPCLKGPKALCGKLAKAHNWCVFQQRPEQMNM